MKGFIKRIFIYTIVFCFLVFGLGITTDYSAKRTRNKTLELDKNIRIVFAGDSNIECAINDSIVESSINIAQSAETYLYTYIKLKSLIEYNNQIDTVFLGFSFNGLLKETEDRWMYEITKISFYNYLMGFSEKYILMQNQPRAYFQGLLQSIASNLLITIHSFTIIPPNKHVNYFGGYNYLIRSRLEEAKIKYQDPEPEKGQIQEKYLNMISNLCDERSIKLILLNTPKHEFYNNYLNEEIKQNWIKVRTSLSQGILWDMSKFYLPDSCYGDLDHLNYKGARVFSQYLNGLIKSDTIFNTDFTVENPLIHIQ